MRRLFRPERLLTLALIAGCAGIVAYWVMLFSAPAAPVAPSILPSGADTAPDTRAAASLFGSTERPVAIAQASNVQVIGVLAGTPGVAVLAVDGRAPRAIKVGDEAAPGMRLVEVSATEVVLEQAGRRLTVPAPARTSTDLLDSAPVPQGGVSAVVEGSQLVLSNDPDAPGAAVARPGLVAPGAAPRRPDLAAAAGAAFQRPTVPSVPRTVVAAPNRGLPPYGAAAAPRPGVSSTAPGAVPNRTPGAVPQAAVRASPPRAPRNQD